MSNTNVVRTKVQAAYAEAITSHSGCCGPASESTQAVAMGYSHEDISAAGVSAAHTTMGCGNPLAFGDVQPGETVLDLGSGAGLDLLVAAEKVGSEGRVIGIDMTTEMIATAWRNIADSPYRNVEVRQGIIENLPVEDASVDRVISNCVINLSPEKERVFSEIARVLRPGGRFSISDIVVDNLPDQLKTDDVLYNSCIAGAISEEAYLEGLRGAGLTELDVSTRYTYGPEMQAMLKISAEDDTVKTDDPDALMASLENKVHSLNFVGRKSA